jgi:NADH-quinone oxidoreductase subunit G
VMAHRSMTAIQFPESLLKQLENITPSEKALKAAQALKNKEKISILLGHYAISHPHSSAIYALSRWLAVALDATWGEMSMGANSAGAWLAGAVPHRLPMGETNDNVGTSVQEMWKKSLRAYMLMNVEPEYDCADPQLAKKALQAADTVVVLTTFDNPHYREYADVLLPMTPPSEMSGTYVNGVGEWQSFQAAVMPLGESRPAWKILRVLANLWEVRGFGYETVGEVLHEVLSLKQTKPHYADNMVSMPYHPVKREAVPPKHFVRLAPVSLYAVDNIVRRAEALQETEDAKWEKVIIHPEAAKREGLSEGQTVWVNQHDKRSTKPLPIILSEAIPMQTAWVPAGTEAAQSLGRAFGWIELIPA